MSQYDLLLRGGEVIDPASGLRGRFDVAFVGDSVSAIAPNIDPALAAQVESVSGCLVVPGLIDMHTHVFHGTRESVDPDVDCLGRGSTTVGDGGSAGASNFGAFRYIALAKRTRVLAWVNISAIGEIDTRAGELFLLQWVDPEGAVATARANPDMVVGFKARLSTYAVGWTCRPVLRLAREAADAAGLPLMVHIGDTGESLAEILSFMRAGDVVSHIYTGRRSHMLQPDGRVIPEVFEARERGVLFDSARGRNHAAFHIMQAAIEQGFLPDTLSTDITPPAALDPEFGLPLMANHLLSFGVPLEEVLACVTTNPARALRRPDLGRLAVGGIGDATVLRLETGERTVRDVDGRTRQMDRWLAATGVVRAGRYTPIGKEGLWGEGL